MKGYKLLSITQHILLICVLISGCNNIANFTKNTNEEPAENYEEINANDTKFISDRIINGANEFTFKMSSTLAPNYKNENFIISPYSIWLPLVNISNTMNDNFKDNLLLSLDIPGVNKEITDKSNERIMYYLENKTYLYNEKYHNPFITATAIFKASTLKFEESFAEFFTTSNHGSIMNVNFNNDNISEIINKWAKESTLNLIDNVHQDIKTNTKATMVNVTYFNDKWIEEFDINKTIKDVFHSIDKDVEASYMVKEDKGQMYYEDDNLQAIVLLNRVSIGGMFILLPKDMEATDLLTSMTNDYFAEIKETAKGRTGKLLVPRFTLEANIQLEDTLKSLGITLFDETKAPTTKGNTSIWLSGATQKLILNIDEKGINAPAETMITDRHIDKIPSNDLEFIMNCNKPFVIIITGASQVLYIGVVNNV